MDSQTRYSKMDDLPKDALEEAERLTHLAREAIGDEETSAYRSEREKVLEECGYTARIREDDSGDVLVCYPSEWVEDGMLQPEHVDNVDRGVERQISGAIPDDSTDWDAVAAHNDDLADRVATDAGEVHGTNARALADFASNHCAKRIDELSRAEVERFLDEYFPRNSWPSTEQRKHVEDSLRLTFEKSDVGCPLSE